MGRTLLKHIPFFKPYFPDRLLQTLSNLFPNQMPKRLDDYYEKYDHYLQLKMAVMVLKKRESISNLILTKPVATTLKPMPMRPVKRKLTAM